jgi:NitT/TauT family transport system permease protein
MKELFQFGGQLSPKKSAITGVIGGIIILLLWYLVTTAGMISQKILPNPVDVIYSLPSLMSDYSLFSNIWYTISLNLTGYFYALIIAIPIGFLIGIYPLPRAMFQKIVEALRFIPIPSVSGILIAIFSIGFGMKSAFLAFGLLIYLVPVITQKIIDLQNPDNVKENVYIQTATTIGMSNWQKFRYVYWPFVMSRVYSDIRSLVAISYTYVVIAESLNKEGGIGALISTLSRQAKMEYVYALLFIIITIGILQDFLLKKLEPVLFKFKNA